MSLNVHILYVVLDQEEAEEDTKGHEGRVRRRGSYSLLGTAEASIAIGWKCSWNRPGQKRHCIIIILHRPQSCVPVYSVPSRTFNRTARNTTVWPAERERVSNLNAFPEDNPGLPNAPTPLSYASPRVSRHSNMRGGRLLASDRPSDSWQSKYGHIPHGVTRELFVDGKIALVPHHPVGVRGLHARGRRQHERSSSHLPGQEFRVVDHAESSISKEAIDAESR